MIRSYLSLCVVTCLIVTVQGRTTVAPLPARTTTEAITTTLRDLSECELGRIRAHSDPNKFEQLTQDENGTDVWLVNDCQQRTLIFNETSCACEHPNVPSCPYTEVSGSTVQYQEALPPFTIEECTIANTFWNQSGCRCDWNPTGPQSVAIPEVQPCETIFSTTFDSSSVGGIVKSPWSPVTTVDANGADGQALVILPHVSYMVWAVSYTQFGPGFVIDFRFKSRNDIILRDSHVALITNGCRSKETIGITYKSIDRTYAVKVKALLLESRTMTDIEFECQDASGVSDGFQWNRVSLSFREGMVNLMVNDALCGSEQIPNAIPDQPKCPLVIGHDSQHPENAQRPGLVGWFDDLSVRRFCSN